MSRLLTTLLVLGLATHGSAKVWSFLFNPKVMTAIAASIGIDVVKDKWLSADQNQMMNQIQEQLRAQMKYQLADALLALQKDDKLPTSGDYVLVYGMVGLGIFLLCVIFHLSTQQRKLKRRLNLEREERA